MRWLHKHVWTIKKELCWLLCLLPSRITCVEGSSVWKDKYGKFKVMTDGKMVV